MFHVAAWCRRHAPSPGNLLGEQASNNRAQRACQCPYSTNDAKVGASVSDGEEVRDANVDQRDNPTAANALYDSGGNEHVHVDGYSGEERAQKENSIGKQ